jgi:hypothetical protein
MSNIRLEGVLAAQQRKRRLARKKKQNVPSAKRKREEHARQRADSMRLFTAHMDAEQCDAQERPLYEIVIEHIDITDAKNAPLRARMIVSVRLAIADVEYRETWRHSTEERTRRLARAREILAMLERAP